jgi:hypothetical protein
MTTVHPEPPALEEQLSQLFGSYKAEWLKEQIFELFTEPSYFPELKTSRSCLLIGGRGTGKTTVLRGLSYQGQYALSKRQSSTIPNWPWYGLYYRVNTNHVTAFNGSELSQAQWIPLFAHYTNLLLCDLILEFLEWYEFHTKSQVDLGERSCRQIATSLHVPQSPNHRQLREALADSRVEFEAYINNVIDASHPSLSMQSAPIDLLCRAIQQLDSFKGKHFFFLLDEYENLLDYQQQVVNTLIKHSDESYSFKVGVRELGWRCRSTLNENEQLVHPADYARVNIGEKMQGDTFEQFALDVCSERIARIQIADQEVIRHLPVALPGVTEEEEALKLGVEAKAQPIRRDLLKRCSEKARPTVENMHPLEIYFVGFWAKSQSIEPVEALEDAVGDPLSWKTRFGNYKHALLYTIREKKRGVRKYFCGWSTFTQLAAGNIRYVLELVDQSFLLHHQETRRLDKPISPDCQTKAAQRVGSMNLAELEGLSVEGAQLTKLLLSLGRVFQIMAKDAIGHAPEVNQFQLADNGPDQNSDAERLLNAAVMHLALLRTPGSKPGDVGDTKDYDYMIHPIYSALFEFSPRRKRKMTITADTLLGLIRRPKHTIRAVLRANNRPVQGELPDQLTLFERFYDADT